MVEQVVPEGQVAPFATVRNELHQWKVEQSDWQGCHDLRYPTRAVPVFSLEDGCPVMMLLDKLRELEWRPMNCIVKHEAVDDKRFDCRNSHNKHLYFRTLLSLPERLLVNPCIHSAQAMSTGRHSPLPCRPCQAARCYLYVRCLQSEPRQTWQHNTAIRQT